MRFTIQNAERGGLALYAGAFAVLPILADHHVISEWVVSAVGVVATAVVGAWKGGKVINAAQSDAAPGTPTDGPVI